MKRWWTLVFSQRSTFLCLDLLYSTVLLIHRTASLQSRNKLFLECTVPTVLYAEALWTDVVSYTDRWTDTQPSMLGFEEKNSDSLRAPIGTSTQFILKRKLLHNYSKQQQQQQQRSRFISVQLCSLSMLCLGIATLSSRVTRHDHCGEYGEGIVSTNSANDWAIEICLLQVIVRK